MCTGYWFYYIQRYWINITTSIICMLFFHNVDVNGAKILLGRYSAAMHHIL